MPRFKNTRDLMAYLQKAVDKALTEDVFREVQKQEAQVIDGVVYSTGTSEFYKRRGNYGGMADPENIVIDGGSAKNGVLVVVNETEPNPYKNGQSGSRATTDKDLPYLIEYGQPQAGDSGYDYWEKPVARPFTRGTIESLDRNRNHVEALREGLLKQGIKVR